MVALASSKERLAQVGALALAAVVSAALATSAASGTPSGRQAAPAGGFAGPVTGPPRTIERHLAGVAGSLQQVPCAAGGEATRCWVSTPQP